ncbi:MAG: response regulator transcription factor [Gallionella sp.]|nr:response regulator transcription factor [Gallionella sp.]
MNDTVALPLTVFVVDDEPLARRRLKELLDDCAVQIELEVTGEAGNGQEALDKLSATPAEVVLLDIRMPQMDGLELAHHLNKLDHPPVIIFTTAYDAYAIKAFEQRAIDYLLKPIRLGRLFEALTRARDAVPIRTEVLRELMPEARSHLPVHERGRIILVPIEEVIYLRAEMKYVTVRTAQREYLIEESLTALEKEYAARFVRIHRSCLAAIAAIAGFEKGGEEGESGWLLKLRGLDERLPISRRQWASVKALDEANGQGV